MNALSSLTVCFNACLGLNVFLPFLHYGRLQVLMQNLRAFHLFSFGCHAKIAFTPDALQPQILFVETLLRVFREQILLLNRFYIFGSKFFFIKLPY
jgi:hypothetical protein